MLLLTGLLAVLCMVLVSGGASAASNCGEEGKEGAGCVLPKGSSYHVRKGKDDEFNFLVLRKTSQLRIRSSCAFEQARRLNTKSRLKVGRTYKFKQTRIVKTTLADGRRTTTTYTLKVAVKINNAKKAVATGTAKAFMPAVPPGGGNPGEDEVRLDCKLNRTLKRALD